MEERRGLSTSLISKKRKRTVSLWILGEAGAGSGTPAMVALVRLHHAG